MRLELIGVDLDKGLITFKIISYKEIENIPIGKTYDIELDKKEDDLNANTSRKTEDN